MISQMTSVKPSPSRRPQKPAVPSGSRAFRNVDLDHVSSEKWPRPSRPGRVFPPTIQPRHNRARSTWFRTIHNDQSSRLEEYFRPRLIQLGFDDPDTPDPDGYSLLLLRVAVPVCVLHAATAAGRTKHDGPCADVPQKGHPRHTGFRGGVERQESARFMQVNKVACAGTVR